MVSSAGTQKQGRPQLEPGSCPAPTWHVRVPHSLDSAVRSSAKAQGYSLSEYVRKLVEDSISTKFRTSQAQHERKGQEDMTDIRQRPFTMVSLFTGAGGLDVGIETTEQFKLLAAVELEPKFCETLQKNKANGIFGDQETKIIQADLSTYSPEQLMAELDINPGDIDVLVGGPPCQSFSTAGRRKGVNDPRGQLIWSFLRFVEVLQPKAFLMENVRGLFSAALKHRPIADRPTNGGEPLTPDEQRGSVFKKWIDDATKISGGKYRIDSFEVNAVNYGAPQIRERVLVFGNRLEQLTGELTPTHGQHSPGLLPFTTLREALDGLIEENPVVLDFSPRKKHFLSHVPTGGNWRSLPDEMARESMGRAYYAKGGRSGWWRRLSWDLPSPTITTMPNHSSTSLCHPEETRVLSVSECARIQGFPDGWEFVGSAAEQMKQVGNAVPARLGEVAAEKLLTILREESPTATADTPRYTNTYVQSHVRTRRWWKDGTAVIHKATATS